MEGEKVETELEFQMTKGELAEYCVNVTVKGIWSQKLAVAVFGMLLLAGVGEGMLMAVMGKGLGYLGGSCVLLVSFCRRNTGCFVYSSVLAVQQAGIPETQGIQGGKRIPVL